MFLGNFMYSSVISYLQHQALVESAVEVINISKLFLKIALFLLDTYFYNSVRIVVMLSILEGPLQLLPCPPKLHLIISWYIAVSSDAFGACAVTTPKIPQ